MEIHVARLIESLSGFRGIIGDSLTPEVALKIAKGYGTFLGKGPVIVGGDTRVSYTMIKNCVVSGLLAVGIDVIDIGQVTTPTVQQMIKHHNATGGMVITASHNPIPYNGIKLMDGSGSFITQDEYDRFYALYHSDISTQSWDKLGTYTVDTTALDTHVDIVINGLDVSAIRDAKLNVLIDANNGAGALADPILMDRLGVNYTIINKEPNGLFSHDPEPLKENLSDIISELKKGHYDIGFVQDADADRLVILDENGRFIGEDYSLAFCIDYILSHSKDDTKDNTVVINLSTSSIIEDIATKYSAKTVYTKIGEPNVTQGIKDHNAVVGGEGNGGVIYPKIGWGRDSLVGMVIALKHLAQAKRPVSEIVNEYPQYIMARAKHPLERRELINPVLEKVKAHFKDYPQNSEDGIKVTLSNSWIHIRPSNTEPILRIFAEAPTQQDAEALITSVKKLI